MSLQEYEHKLSRLRMNTRGGDGGEKSPHKVALLLAVMDLIEQQHIQRNQIYFDQTLRATFTKHFERLANPNDRNNPHLPFFHLRSSGFWHFKLKPGKQDAFAQLSTASGPGVIDQHIAYATLDDELFEYMSYQMTREYLKSALMQNLAPEARRELLQAGKDAWDWLECEAIVQDYFAMLEQEIIGNKYNKAAHRRALLTKLRNRSESSIEFKHQNISAILIELGQPYISGYKPAFNFQRMLKDVVLAHIAADLKTLNTFADAASQAVEYRQNAVDWNSVLDRELPDRIPQIQEAPREYLARKPNYAERERTNRSLGEQGERFVLDFERFRLQQAGRPDLAKEIRWVSNDDGDGAGFDIQSFNVEREEELYIEVKTTSCGKYHPFYISDNELACSKDNEAQYCLYRVYDFRASARLFQLEGAVDRHVNLQAKNYMASFGER
ncbi:DUF3883 domain-containing protein [Ketobacter sp.]|uniref:DUF3883 domain-containing protein n=1 Tax=Ketobacter sp. TaxID=2083498 RepID=UPI000F156D61|nr:DUF3883 domain-containing protein [Ketobacter sp.]RLU01286.1 MAG: DUF3883 domain-containing protein [Ketobacter sp.]